MGIFSQDLTRIQGTSSITGSITLESLVQDPDVDVSNISEDYEYEGNEIITTMNENYNMIMTNIGITEASHFDRYGTEMVYTEGVLSSFISTIKNFLKKIWEKIKGLFKRFTLMIDKYTMEDKAFVKKYRKQLFTGKNLDDMKFKGYVYTIDDNKIRAAVQECTGEAKQASSKAGEGRESFKDNSKSEHQSEDLEKFRGQVLSKMGGQAGSYSQDEFTKEIKELLRNKESEKEELDKIDIYKITNEMMSAKDTKKTLNNMFKEEKRTIDQEEKNLQRAQDAFLKTQPLGSKEGDAIVKDSDKYDNYYNSAKATDDEVAAAVDALKKEVGSGTPPKGYDEASAVSQASAFVALKSTNNDAYNLINKHLEKSHKRIGTAYDADLENNNDLGIKASEKSERVAREYNYYLRDIRDTKTIMLSIQTAVMAALKERSRQNKAICVKVIHYNPKEESYNESYSYNDYPTSGSNFLSSIELK